MKIQDIRKKYPKHDVYSTISWLNKALKIFGLSCVYREGDKLKYSFPFMKIIFILTLIFIANAFSIYSLLQNQKGQKIITFEDTIQIPYLLGYLQYITDVIFVYKYGRQSYIDYFIAYNYIDSILGMSLYKETKRTIKLMSLFFVFIATILIIIDIITWITELSLSLINIYFIEMIYIILRMLTSLDTISNCILLKYRLETIGDLLQNYYNNAEDLPGVIKDFIYDKALTNKDDWKKSYRLDALTTISNGRGNIIMWLSRCYVLLNEQCDFINIKHGFRMFLGCLLYLLDMILMVNLIIRILLGTMVLPSTTIYLPIISTMAKILSDTLIIFCGIYYCEQNYRQTDRIIRSIDHILIKKKISKEIQETLKDLKSLIVTRPINYHAINFYRLDYAILVSMASVIVTYSILLLQNL